MKDSWIGPLIAVLLVGCCLLLETGIGGAVLSGLAAYLGYQKVALGAGLLTLLLVGGWAYRSRSGAGHRDSEPFPGCDGSAKTSKRRTCQTPSVSNEST